MALLNEAVKLFQFWHRFLASFLLGSSANIRSVLSLRTLSYSGCAAKSYNTFESVMVVVRNSGECSSQNGIRDSFCSRSFVSHIVPLLHSLSNTTVDSTCRSECETCAWSRNGEKQHKIIYSWSTYKRPSRQAVLIARHDVKVIILITILDMFTSFEHLVQQ